MASTFENDLRLEEIGTGEKSGTWGVTTNTNLELIGDAFGYAPKVLANAATDTLTVPDGTSINAEARAMYIRYSGGNQDCTVTIGPNTLSKVWFIHNGTSHTITFSQGSGTNVAIAAGRLKAIATDGGGSVAKVYDITQNISIPDLFVDNTLTVAGNTDLAAVEFNSLSGTGSVTITDILDEDNMASNSPTKLSTQQSIKAYVDSQVATSDTLTEVLANGNTTATDQKIQFRDSAIYINSSVDGQLDIVADTEIQLTAPTVDLNGNLNVSGTVDGVDIAARDAVLTSTTTTANAALPKAGGAMTGAITTNSTFDGRDVATDGTKLDGIEASADVTDATNVTAAGALMDSEVTNLAEVKAFDSTDYATAAQGTTADAALPKAGGAMTGAITTNSTFDGRDVATDGTKLDTIETNADVTDTANVTAAGALMDSEVDADIKTLSLPANTTISAYGKTIIDDANASAARTTLGVAIGTNVQAYSSVLQNTTASFTTADETKLDYITVTQAVSLDQMEIDIAALENGMVYKGDWNAGSGSFPGGGSAQTGWFYYVSGAGTVNGISFTVGDNIVATTDNASTSTYASNWSKHDQTDAVQAVVGLTGSITKSGLLSALNVEDGADVTDTANVTSAGALMDSEVTNLAQVKAFNSSDYATAAQGTTANAALPKAGGAMTGAITTNSTFDGRDVSADGTKLDTNIPASLGTAGQVLTVNSGASAGEWADAGGGADLYAANPSSATNPVANGANSIAIGDGMTTGSSGIGAVAIGQDGTVSGTNSVSLGKSGAFGTASFAAIIGNVSYPNYGAVGDNSISIGYQTKANSTGSVAIGYQSKSEGSKSVALGTSYASGTDSFAAVITTNSASYGARQNNAVVIGQAAKSTGAGGLALGNNANVSGSHASAIGRGNTASGNYSTALGYYNTASGTNSVSLGANSTASHEDSIVLGDTASSSAINQITLGSSSDTVRISSAYTLPTSDGSANQVLTTNGSGVISFATAGGGSPDLFAENPSSATTPVASGTNAVAIGSNSTATGTNSFAIGLADGDATGSYSFAVGGQATNIYAIAISNGSSAQGSKSVSIGNGSRAQASESVALGANSQALTNARAVAIGKSYASGTGSFAAAIDNNTSSYGATGANSVAIGLLAKAAHANGIAIGKDTLVDSGADGIALGRNARAANNAISIGQTGLGGGQSYAQGQGSISIGQNNLAQQAASVVLGIHGHSNTMGKYVYSSAYLGGQGNAQTGTFVLIASTTDATATSMATGSGSATAVKQMTLPNNSAYTFSGTVVAREKASEGTDVGAWEVKGIIRREANAGTTVLVNSVINEFNSPTGWAVALTADTTNGCLKVEATGVASTNIRWVATIQTSEVTYA